MSVKIMGEVWDLSNDVIDREEKYVLLAYADHADHNGDNMFPSIELICKKTGYKERAAQLITHSLEDKGFLIAAGKGPKGTNKWSYGGGAFSAGAQKSPDGGAKVTGKGVHPIAPEPLRTIKEPSTVSEETKAKLPIDWKISAGLEITQADIDAANDTPLIQFERAFQFGKLPWASTSVWEKFERFVRVEYSESQTAFGEYTVWRAGEGKYTSMSNKQIRMNPQVFMDCWPEFKARRIAPRDYSVRESREI